MVWDIQKLFLRHAKELTRSLRRRGLAEDTAADITQDVFVRMLTAAPQGCDDNPRAYLFKISRNLTIDYNRRQTASPIDYLEPEKFLSVPDATPSAEKTLYDKQRLHITEQALSQLPPRTRRAFELHRLEGLTITQAAEEIGLSTTQTWTLIHDAYRHIRKRLKDV